MSIGVIIAVVVVVVLIIVALVILGSRLARSRRLRTEFGPEYDREAEATGSKHKAEEELRARERRHAKLDIRPLDRSTRERYATEWEALQERFVDAPVRSVHEADRLVTGLMAERGYPTEGYEQQTADLSVEHASTLDHYRTAHDISERMTEERAGTEEMRRAMVHYRALFDDLLDVGAADSRPRDDRTKHGGAPEPGQPKPDSRVVPEPGAQPAGWHDGDTGHRTKR